MLVKVRPPYVELNEFCLANLLWDALVEEHPDKVERSVRFVFYLPDVRVKTLIGRRLVRYGADSVSCGPEHAFPSAAVERQIRQRVVEVYGA